MNKKMRRNLMSLVTALMLIALVSVFGMPMFAKAEAAAHVSHEGHSDAACHDGWTAISNITELMNLFETGGSGYLTADIDMGDNFLEVNGNTKVTLCLNGYSIIRKQIDGPVPYTIIIRDNSVFTLYDESENTGKITHVNHDGGACVLIENSAEFIMNGGTITVNEAGDKGSGVNLSSGKFTMNDGIITGNGNGGVYEDVSAQFTMNGGIISNNVSDFSGGGIYVSEGALFTMNGGTISGNKSVVGGGLFYCGEQNIILTGGEISNNEASISGGGVFIEGSFSMTGGNIKNNSAQNGGGVYAKGTFTMSDGSISCNNAYRGGGITCDEVTFTMNGGTITENKSDTHGGGVHILCGTFTMNNGNILKNNTAACDGGGVSLEKSVFNMNGGTISENNANRYGGGVIIFNDSSMTMKGGKILRNEAGNDGAGIYNLGSEFTMSGGEISENKAESSGGALYFNNGTFLIKSGTVKDNTAKSGEGIYVESEGKIIGGNISDDVRHYPDLIVSVTFNPNKGRGNTIREFWLKGIETDLYGNGFSRTGFSFVNWNTKEDGTGDSFEDSESMQMLDDLILYAQWKPDKYTVKFDANGGSGTMSSQSINYNVSTALSQNKFAYTGYVYKGWNTKADGTGTSYSDGQKVSLKVLNTDEVILYAQWQEAEDTPYKAEHYLQNLDGTYPKEPIETDEYKGTTNSFVTPDVKYYEGFTTPALKTVSVNADGSTVVRYEYKRNTYTLKWDFGGAVVEGDYTSGKVKYGAPIKAPVSLSKTGYEFMYWNYDVLPETMPAENITIKAFLGALGVHFKVEHYKQKLDGTYSQKPNDVEELNAGADSKIKVCTMEYKGFTSPTPEKVKINADGSTVVQYYYTRNSYTLTWDFAGGSASGNYTSGKVKYQEAITAPVPVKRGYIFVKWDKTVSEKMPARDVKYTAVWREPTKKETATVKFDLNKGDSIKGDSTMKIVKGTEYGTLPKATRAGYKFAGWYTERLKGTKVYSSTICNDSIVLYARWEANEKVSYKVEHYLQKTNGKYNSKADKTETKSCLIGQTVTPKVLTYDGFNSPSAKSVKISKEGIVVKYQYTRKAYTLKWDFNGGSASGSYTSGKVLYGAKITAPVPVRDGYKFAGWNKSVPSTMPNNSLTIKAKWTKLSQEEEVSQFVERFYDILLERPSDKAGLKTWTDNLISGKNNGADVAVGIVTSEEFKNKEMSDDQYVRKLYAAFFDRDPDKSGYDIWMRKLKSGASREEVLRGFINSEEFQNLCKKYGIKPGSY